MKTGIAQHPFFPDSLQNLGSSLCFLPEKRKVAGAFLGSSFLGLNSATLPEVAEDITTIKSPTESAAVQAASARHGGRP